MNYEIFKNGYLRAVLFTENDDNGEPLDTHFTIENFSFQALIESTRVCDSFLIATKGIYDFTGIEDQAGIDFWLTRNGHGAGFWDRPELYGGQRIADRLSEQAAKFGGERCYINEKTGLIEFGF